MRARVVHKSARVVQSLTVTPLPETVPTYTLPEIAEITGLPVTRVRRLIEEHQLAATRIDNVLRVPQAFMRDGAPVGELHGTFVLLADLHFSDDEIVEWMFTSEESLGVTPMDALLAGRKAEVRRIAQALL